MQNLTINLNKTVELHKNNEESALNLIQTIVYFTTATAVIVLNILFLVFYLKFKEKGVWKISDFDMMLILLYNIISGITGYITGLSFSIQFHFLDDNFGCIFKYCLVYMITLDLSKLNFFNGLERFVSIRFKLNQLSLFNSISSSTLR